MPDWLRLVIVLAIWIVIQLWLMPWCGVAPGRRRSAGHEHGTNGPWHGTS